MQTERTQVDGITTFWAPAPGQFTAALQFRVGVADETPPTRGITHLIEHLALFASASRSDEANGFVDGDRCVFYARGERDEVLAWLRRCSEALADLPFERLAVERRILRAEEAGRTGGALVSRLLDLRFGAAGYGLANWPEFGLRWLGEDEVAAWARERFTRGNAALWMTGEPPDAFALALPDGERLPPPRVEPLPGHEGRLLHPDGTGGLAVAGLAERSSCLSAAIAIAYERLYGQLRRELGLVYEPWVGYEILGPRHAHVLMGAECADDQAAKVADEVWRVVNALAAHGVSRDELAEYVRRFRQADGEPGAELSALDHAAAQHLIGEEPIDRDEVARELEEAQPEQVAAAVARAFEDALFIVPATVRSVAGFRDPGFEWPDPIEGKAFADDQSRGGVGSVLRVGDRGVTISGPSQPTTTILWDDVVLVESAPAGTLRLVARDSSWIELRLSSFPAAARERVLARVAGMPVIPTGTVEATEAVQALADRLADDHHVAAELAALPPQLGEDEVPEAVLPYRHGDDRGLLALTSNRLIRWYLGRETDGEAIPRDTIRRAQVRRRLLRPPLLVVEHEQSLEVTVDDGEAAEALVERLSRPGD